MAVTNPATAKPDKVKVQVVDRAATRRVARAEVLLRVAATQASQVDLAVNYEKFRHAHGADWGNRLRLVALPECALTTPDSPGCEGTPLPSTNDTAGWVSGQVTALTDQGGLYALSAGESGSTGSFSASPLSPSATWGVAGNSGDFTWAYPMRVPPPLGGPTPSLSLAYSAQSVDGRHAATNNQPSWVGEGFDVSMGFIERRYKSCAEDLGGNNGQTKTGDLCWATNNAMLTMEGRGGDLIKVDSGGNTWRLRNDDGTRVQLLKDKTRGVGDELGEYWKVTSRDGTQYFFGLNKLPGWTSTARTKSAWTVPVYSNNSGEPCYESSFDASDCVLPWRWNLDYVIDVHGNTMSLWYEPESNKYARNLIASKVSSYTRGGALRQIDYGTRDGTPYTTPPTQVLFDTEDRCLSNCTTHGANWPDTPWDLHCAVTATTCDHYSPTFWTTKRLSTVTTRVFHAGAWSTADTWTLKHSFPDPGDSTRAGLWLSGVARAGVPAEVKFEGVQMPNRVDTTGDYRAAMNWWRIKWIRSEFGGLLGVTYSPPECVAGSKVPTNPESNTLRCYPSKWTPSGFKDPITDYFHKYVTTDITEADLSGGGTTVRTKYDYPNLPAWHYADEDGLVTDRYQTWSVWRGYDLVHVTEGVDADRTFTERRYYRGMHGDKLPSGTRTVYSEDSEGGKVLDHDAFAGMLREEITYNGPGGAQVSGTVHVGWQSPSNASRTIDGVTVHARFVGTASERTRVALDGGRGWRRTTKTTTYDNGNGLAQQVHDASDDSRADDDQCLTYFYVRNEAKWITRITGTQVAALPCGEQITAAADIARFTRVHYDGLVHGTEPVKGNATLVEEFDGLVGGEPKFYARSRAEYDSHGRITKSIDAEGHALSTTFTPSTGGPLVKTATANAKGYAVTTEYHPTWGLPVKVTDANARVTEMAYDSLGRLAQLWKPNRSRANSQTASATYAYRLPSRLPDGNPDGVPAVSTSVLGPNGNYLTTQTLYDGLVRTRQTQVPAGDASGDRVIADTFYDTVGRPFKANVGYAAAGSPATTLFIPEGGDASIEAQTLTVYDGADRTVAEVLRRHGAELWRTSYRHAGDLVDVIPPAGGTARSTATNARGSRTELRVYHSATPTGPYDATTYTYEKTRLKKVADKHGNTWTYGYDDRGRQNSTTDPDKGESKVTMNNLDQVVTATDSRQRTLSYGYDELGRKTSMSEVTSNGLRTLAQWAYDTTTGGLGLLAAESRHIGSDVYKSEITGYGELGQPTGLKITIPAVEGKLAGTYTYGMTFGVDGSPATASLPAAGGLPKEVLGFGYNNAGRPTRLTNSINLVAGQYVENTQYTKFGEPSVYTFATTPTDKLVQQAYTYEGTTRRLIRSIAKKETSTALLSDVHYAWNPAGNITSIADAVAADTQCFRYDDLARLSEAWTPTSGECADGPQRGGMGGPAPYWESYSQDDLGNRLSTTRYGATSAQDEVTMYTYPAVGAGQPHALKSRRTTVGDVAEPDRTYTYDSTGNTTSMPGPTGQQTLTWDTEGHLAVVNDPLGDTSHLYDANGSRLITRDPTGSTLYLPGTELRFDKATGLVSGTRFYSHGGSTIAQRGAAGVVWLLPDRQGTAQLSVRATTDQPVTKRWQSPYGERRGPAADWPNQHGFLNGTNDPTGTVHLGAREYDPATGRFISVDPLIDTDSPQQMHGYSYSDNNPITLSDPSGLYASSGGSGCTNGCSKDQNLHNKRHKRTYTGYGLGKGDGTVGVISDGGYLGLGKRKQGPHVNREWTIEWYGPIHPCEKVSNAVGPCFVGSDGHVWDLYGHHSCAEVTSANPCGAQGATELPHPVAGGDYVEVAEDKQPYVCEVPGARRPAPTYIGPPPNNAQIRSAGPSLLPDLPGSIVLGAELCVLSGCVGLALHEDGIDATYGRTYGIGGVLSGGPKIGYTSAEPSEQQDGAKSYEGCISSPRIGACGVGGKRANGGGYWYGFNLTPGGTVGVSGGWSKDAAMMRWRNCASNLQAGCV